MMNLFQKVLVSFLGITVSIVISACLGLSGTTGNKKEPLNDNFNPTIIPASPYKDACGQCHLLYPTDFLPSGSWEKIMGSTDKHFGESLDIDSQSKIILIKYLKENSAERSGTKIAKKIVESLDGNTPLRLTEVPYIQKKHRKISSDVFQRSSIGSFSNCIACHLSADNWIFDKRVKIPKK